MAHQYKLGVTYSLFIGEELLEASVKSIRNQVDYINVVYQEYSWTGEKCTDQMHEVLSGLLERGLIDHVIQFAFDPHDEKAGKNISRYMCRKKNLGIKDLIKQKCTHCMIMDVDEFYVEDEFRKAKEYVYSNHITHSACSIYDYRILPVYRMRDTRDYCVPFILKLSPWSRIIGKGNMPCKLDVRRVFLYLPVIHKFYYLNMISMHHMTGIRRDYEFKIKCSDNNFSEKGKTSLKHYSRMHRELAGMSEKEILENGYIKVEDKFGILEAWNQ